MKKIKYFLMLLFVSMVALTGCGTKNELSVSETFEKAVANVEAAENLKMNAIIEIGMKAEGLTVDMKVNMDMINDLKNGKTKTNMTMNMFGFNMETEMYTDSKSIEGKTITYTKDVEGNWTKEITDSEENTSDSSTEFLKTLADNNSIKELKSDKNNYNYQVIINSDTLKGLMGSMDDDTLSDYTDVLTGNMKIIVSIDKKTYNYSKISMDMTDMMKDYMKELGAELTKAEFVINFSDYNKAGSVVIPSDVEENAIDDDFNWDDSDFYEDDYEEIWEDDFDFSDYDDVISCSMFDNDDATTRNYIDVLFNDNKSVALVYTTYMDFDSREDAKAYYDNHAHEYTKISRDGVYIQIENPIEKIKEDEQMSYDEMSDFLTTKGYLCQRG